MTRVLGGLGVPLAGAVVYDGSGLSRQDRLDPDTLAAVLAPRGRPATTPSCARSSPACPVAGFTGSLDDRFADADPQGRGRVRAKTGTLTGVHAPRRRRHRRDRRPMAFVLIADRVAVPDTLAARARSTRSPRPRGLPLRRACSCGRGARVFPD